MPLLLVIAVRPNPFVTSESLIVRSSEETCKRLKPTSMTFKSQCTPTTVTFEPQSTPKPSNHREYLHKDVEIEKDISLICRNLEEQFLYCLNQYLSYINLNTYHFHTLYLYLSVVSIAKAPSSLRSPSIITSNHCRTISHSSLWPLRLSFNPRELRLRSLLVSLGIQILPARVTITIFYKTFFVQIIH